MVFANNRIATTSEDTEGTHSASVHVPDSVPAQRADRAQHAKTVLSLGLVALGQYSDSDSEADEPLQEIERIPFRNNLYHTETQDIHNEVVDIGRGDDCKNREASGLTSGSVAVQSSPVDAEAVSDQASIDFISDGAISAMSSSKKSFVDKKVLGFKPSVLQRKRPLAQMQSSSTLIAPISAGPLSDTKRSRTEINRPVDQDAELRSVACTAPTLKALPTDPSPQERDLDLARFLQEVSKMG